MAVIDIVPESLITEIRSFLMSTLEITGEDQKQVIKDTQNYASLPHNAITIAFLFDSDMDLPVTSYDGPNSKAGAQTSTEARVQISFYGVHAGARSRLIATLWRSIHATERLTLCQPLYVQSRNRMPYINDSNQYEDRYILDLALQYNPQVIYDQDFTKTANILINPVKEG